MGDFVVRSTPAKGFVPKELNTDLQVALSEQGYSCEDGTPILYVHQLSGIVRLYNLNDSIDISDLGRGNIVELALCYCKGVTNIDELAKSKTLKKLTMIACTNVKDIMALGESETLEEIDLWNCISISTVPKFKRVKMLSLRSCRNITDVTPLGETKTLVNLELSGCTNIKDVSSLTHITTLCLWGCSSVTDVSMFANSDVKELDLKGCTGITDRSMLGNVNVILGGMQCFSGFTYEWLRNPYLFLTL